MNKTAAKEWLVKSWHHLSSAKILLEANHYTDTIAVELHYTVEITLKAFLAFNNEKIIKSHNLLEIHSHIKENIFFSEEELDFLMLITNYHIKESYPMPNRSLPEKEEVKEVLKFATRLLEKVCKTLSIDVESIKH